MKFNETKFEGLVLIEPNVHEDERGYFFESYSDKVFQKNNIKIHFIQDNESLSQKGVVRGLHFQNPPHAQAKLVRVIKGAVLDVVVDIRKYSKTYGEHFPIEISEKNRLMLFIPEGFAHGFLTLRNDTIFSYKCSKSYNKEAEDSILWNDSSLGIDWGISDPIVSDKDKIGNPFKTFNSSF